MADEPFHLKNTALAITERCTLRCKLCFAYIPYHENPVHMSLEYIEDVLSRYFAIVASVDCFCITGGEPLLHPDLLTILEMVQGYSSQINTSIDLITNGTMDMPDDIIGFLKEHKDRIRVIISDYGKYSPKAESVAEQVRSAGIEVRVEGYSGDSPLHGGWIDCTDHSLKHFTQEEVDAQGRRCYFKNKRGYTIRNGELHNCGRSYWRMRQGIVPRNPEEYLNLLDTTVSVEEQRETLRRLHKKVSVTSCAYCWGTNSDRERRPPAEQLDPGR